jgi:hypothetical protein
MTYSKATGSYVEYQGESFSLHFQKKDDKRWLINEIVTCKLIDNTGSVLYEDQLDKNIDALYMMLFIGQSVTSTLLGDYKLLIYINDSDDPEVNYVIAEFKMKYKKAKARIE